MKTFFFVLLGRSSFSFWTKMLKMNLLICLWNTWKGWLCSLVHLKNLSYPIPGSLTDLKRRVKQNGERIEKQSNQNFWTYMQNKKSTIFKIFKFLLSKWCFISVLDMGTYFEEKLSWIFEKTCEISEIRWNIANLFQILLFFTLQASLLSTWKLFSFF